MATLPEMPLDYNQGVPPDVHYGRRLQMGTRSDTLQRKRPPRHCTKLPGAGSLFSVPQEDLDYSEMECDPDQPDANHEGSNPTRDD